MSVLMINFPVNLSPLMPSLLQIIWLKLGKMNFLNKQFLAPNFAMLDGNSKQFHPPKYFANASAASFEFLNPFLQAITISLDSFYYIYIYLIRRFCV